MFVVPLDRRRGWYRYHALFREFLLGELRRVEPDVMPKLHLRAADWYEANGTPALAVERLLHTSERDRCVQLVTTLVLPTRNLGQLRRRSAGSRRRRCGDRGLPATGGTRRLGRDTGRTHHRRATVGHDRRHRIVRRSTGRRHRVVRLGAGDAAQPHVSRRSRQAVRTGCRDRRRAAVEPMARSSARHLRRGASADRETSTGRAALFAESAGVSAASPTDPFVVSESEFALLAMDRGQWDEAAEHSALALAAIDEQRMHDYATSVLAFAGAARLAVHRGDMQEANRQLTRRCAPARHVRSRFPVWRCVPDYSWRRCTGRTRNHTTARHLLREIDDILLHRPDLGVLVDEVSQFRDVVASSVGSGASGGPPLTPAELRLLPYLQTHLTFREIGERLFVSRTR